MQTSVIPEPKIPPLFGSDCVETAREFVRAARELSRWAYRLETVVEGCRKVDPASVFSELERLAVDAVANVLDVAWPGIQFGGSSLPEAFRAVFAEHVAPLCQHEAAAELARMKEERSMPLAYFQLQFKEMLLVAGPLKKTTPVECYIAAVAGEEDRMMLKRYVQQCKRDYRYPTIDELMEEHMESSD